MKRNQQSESARGLKAGPLHLFAILTGKKLIKGLTRDEAALLRHLWDTYPAVRGLYKSLEQSKPQTVQSMIDEQSREKP